MVTDCPECSKKNHLYIDGTTGKFTCQRCGQFSGNFAKLKQYITPPNPFAEVYNYFHEATVRALAKNDVVLGYLEDRGFNEESIIRFRYGYADESLNDKLLKKFGVQTLVESGLWVHSEKRNDDFARFYDHIIIPYMRGERYLTFQGRNLDETAKARYTFAGKPMETCLYHGEDLAKRGRVYLTEGAFKRDRLAQEDVHAVGLPGASNWKKFLTELRKCEDLWIILDSDQPDEHGRRPGQDNALELAKTLRSATIITLPLPPDKKKVGVDDFIEDYGYDALSSITPVRYENGSETKPTSLSILVSDWKKRVESHTDKLGFELGYERLDKWLEGYHPGALTFIAGSPHVGKTAYLEENALRVYGGYPELKIDYYTNDDSLFTTLTRWVAKLGKLKQKDCRYPLVAFEGNEKLLNRYEAASRRLSMMSDRLTILDRSYNIHLETLKDQLVRWRYENQDAERIVFIDAFTKTQTKRDIELRDEMSRTMYKGSLLKEIAQEAHVPIAVTHELPKMAGRRPNSWNLRGSNTLEYDADVILLCYQEAHVKGIQDTSIRIDYTDTGEKNPVMELIIGKDKMCGTPRLTDLFEIDKANSKFKELDNENYDYLMQKVRESQRKEFGE